MSLRMNRDADEDPLPHPAPPSRGAALLQALQAFGDDLGAEFVTHLETERDVAPPSRERDIGR